MTHDRERSRYIKRLSFQFPSFLTSEVLMVGDSGAGKSCLLLRFTDNTFSTEFISTIGVDFKVKEIEIDGKAVTLQMWDTAGQERFRNITQSYYRGSNGVVVVFDITDRMTFDHLTFWLKEIEKHASPTITRLLVGNKQDLKESRSVSRQEAELLASQYGMGYIEASAKTGYHIEKMFCALAEVMMETQKRTPEPEASAAIEIPVAKPVEKKGCC